MIAWLALLAVWAIKLPLMLLWGPLRGLRVLPTLFALVDGATADALRLASFVGGSLVCVLPAVAPLLVWLRLVSVRQVARLLVVYEAAVLAYVVVRQNRGVLGLPFDSVVAVQSACVALSAVSYLLAPSPAAPPSSSVFAWVLATVLLGLHAIPVVADIGHFSVPPFWRIISESEQVLASVPLTVAEKTAQGSLGLAHAAGALAILLSFVGGFQLRAAATVCALVQVVWLVELLQARRGAVLVQSLCTLLTFSLHAGSVSVRVRVRASVWADHAGWLQGVLHHTERVAVCIRSTLRRSSAKVEDAVNLGAHAVGLVSDPPNTAVCARARVCLRATMASPRYWLEPEARVEEVTLYETPQRFYLVGTSNDEPGMAHVARVDRSDIYSVNLMEDGHHYTLAEVAST